MVAFVEAVEGVGSFETVNAANGEFARQVQRVGSALPALDQIGLVCIPAVNCGDREVLPDPRGEYMLMGLKLFQKSREARLVLDQYCFSKKKLNQLIADAVRQAGDRDVVIFAHWRVAAAFFGTEVLAGQVLKLKATRRHQSERVTIPVEANARTQPMSAAQVQATLEQGQQLAAKAKAVSNLELPPTLPASRDVRAIPVEMVVLARELRDQEEALDQAGAQEGDSVPGGLQFRGAFVLLLLCLLVAATYFGAVFLLPQ